VVAAKLRVPASESFALQQIGAARSNVAVRIRQMPSSAAKCHGLPPALLYDKRLL
jgi:hypothetical protein